MTKKYINKRNFKRVNLAKMPKLPKPILIFLFLFLVGILLVSVAIAGLEFSKPNKIEDMAERDLDSNEKQKLEVGLESEIKAKIDYKSIDYKRIKQDSEISIIYIDIDGEEMIWVTTDDTFNKVIQ